ncbi:hypothetical protein [Azospirillum doebereinerae]|uniref:Uncharacterized protein n=1 Tax=Azospirillum doebereinerae TaxID=92933 RepID=A0A3S0V6B4_9PROT|nr:hypothetical protein EJ913_13135 [Azospirillum doebereinerae]
MAHRRRPFIPDILLDQLLAGADPKSVFDPDGLLDGLKKALGERTLNGEMDDHLASEAAACNSRNGYACKAVLGRDRGAGAGEPARPPGQLRP